MKTRIMVAVLTVAMSVLAVTSPAEARRWRRSAGWYGGGPGWHGNAYGGPGWHGNAYGGSGWHGGGGGYTGGGGWGCGQGGAYYDGACCAPSVVDTTVQVAPATYTQPNAWNSAVCCY